MQASGGKQPTRVEYLAEQLFFVVPFPTREVGAELLSKRTKSEVTVPLLDAVLGYVRENRESLGWTVTYAKRGPNADDRDRYRLALMERDGTFHSDDDLTDIEEGMVSSSGSMATMSDRLAATLRMVASRTKSRNLARVFRGSADDLDFISHKLADAVEVYREELESANGA